MYYMSVIGASIVLWFYDDNIKQPVLLVGKESRYMSDFPQYRDIVREKEFFRGTDLVQAKNFFSKNAQDLEDMLKIQVKFDTPVLVEGGYIVHYRFLEGSFKRGIIKGGIEGSETSEQAILREIREEVGLNIPNINELVTLGICDRYQVYALDIKKKNCQEFEKRIRQRYLAKSGEVFDLSFKTLTMIEGQLSEYNYKSICSINLFKKYFSTLTGGKRKKNKSKKTRKSKNVNRKTRTNR